MKIESIFGATLERDRDIRALYMGEDSDNFTQQSAASPTSNYENGVNSNAERKPPYDNIDDDQE